MDEFEFEIKTPYDKPYENKHRALHLDTVGVFEGTYRILIEDMCYFAHAYLNQETSKEVIETLKKVHKITFGEEL